MTNKTNSKTEKTTLPNSIITAKHRYVWDRRRKKAPKYKANPCRSGALLTTPEPLCKGL